MIQVLHRAVDILEFIAKSPARAAGLAEIADTLTLNRATCANILKTLADRNLVEQDDSKQYRFGPLLYQLTEGFYYNTALVMAAKDAMEDLTAHLNESTLLAVIRNYKRIAIHQVESNHDLHVKSRLEKDVYETATGRLLFAYYSDKKQKSFLRKMGMPSAAVWEEASYEKGLARELEKIQQESMAIQVSAQHVVGFAVPIYQQDQVVASLGVFLPTARLTEGHQKTIVNSMSQTARVISQNLSKEGHQRLLNTL